MFEHGLVDSRLFYNSAPGSQISEKDGKTSRRMVGLVDGTDDRRVADLFPLDIFTDGFPGDGQGSLMD